MVTVLAGLPLLARWRFRPAAPGRTARALRSGVYAVVLILTVAKASVGQVRDAPAAVPHLKPDDPVGRPERVAAPRMEQAAAAGLLACSIIHLADATAISLDSGTGPGVQHQ